MRQRLPRSCSRPSRATHHPNPPFCPARAHRATGDIEGSPRAGDGGVGGADLLALQGPGERSAACFYAAEHAEAWAGEARAQEKASARRPASAAERLSALADSPLPALNAAG